MYIRDLHNPNEHREAAPAIEARATQSPIGSLRKLSSLFGTTTDAGVPITETTALNIAALFRACTILAQSQAQIPIEVIQDKRLGFEARPDHRVADLMNLDANDNDLAFVVREQVAWDAAWFGDGYAEIELDGRDKPVGYHYLENCLVEPRWVEEPDPQIKNKKYRREYVIDGDTQKPYPANRILHLPGLQFDGLNGKGIVRIARESLSHTAAIEKHGATTFGNNGIPAGVIEAAQERDDATKARMRKSFKTQGRNDVVVMDNGDKFVPMGLSNVDTQFLEARVFQVIEISRWTGVPPHLLMDMTRANYNSLELIGGEFKALTLVPWCERWRGEVRKKLFTPGERRVRYDVRFNYDAFLRADRKTRYDAHRIGITSGFLTRNEARVEEGMTPLDGGDDLLTPLNMVNANDPTALDPNADKPAGDSQPGDQVPGDSGGAGGK